MARVNEPQASYVVDRNGKKKAVILTVEHYERLMDDLADLAAIASRKKEKATSWTQVKKRLKRDGLLED